MILCRDPKTDTGHALVEFLRLEQSCHYEKISSVTALGRTGEGQSGFQSC